MMKPLLPRRLAALRAAAAPGARAERIPITAIAGTALTAHWMPRPPITPLS